MGQDWIRPPASNGFKPFPPRYAARQSSCLCYFVMFVACMRPQLSWLIIRGSVGRYPPAPPQQQLRPLPFLPLPSHRSWIAAQMRSCIGCFDSFWLRTWLGLGEACALSSLTGSGLNFVFFCLTVSKRFYALVTDHRLWTPLYLRHFAYHRHVLQQYRSVRLIPCRNFEPMILGSLSIFESAPGKRRRWICRSQPVPQIGCGVCLAVCSLLVFLRLR
jgi:hypothetical protein